MKITNKLGSALALIGALTLGACATDNSPNYRDSPSTQYSEYTEYGVVQHIEFVDRSNGGIGLGTVAGAVVGGVAGNQFGAGQGRTAATVLGAAGGAYVGHELENRQDRDVYKITVRMDDGSRRTLTQNTNSRLSVGDRVRIRDGDIQRY